MCSSAVTLGGRGASSAVCADGCGTIPPTVKNRGQNVLETAQLQEQCPGTIWAVAPPADSRAHLSDASSRASWCRQPQTIAETRVPTVRRPSPGRRVAQPGLSRRIGAGRTTGDAILSQDL